MCIFWEKKTPPLGTEFHSVISEEFFILSRLHTQNMVLLLS